MSDYYDEEILLDAGHGINTKGKSSPDCALMEWRYNREIANAIARGLILRGYDAEVIVPELEDVSLKERVDRVNRIACKYGISDSLLLSIHVNAAGNGSQWMNARGWCAYTSRGNTRANALATSLYQAAQASLPGKRLRTDYTDGDSDMEADFYILRHTTAPAVLTENFFMDSHPDCAFLLSEEGQSAIVNLHVTGITAYLSTL